MKRFSSMMAAAMFVVMAAVVLVTTAAPASAKTNGAIVTRTEDGCFISVLGQFLIGDLQDVQTPSGNEKFTCIAQLAPGTEPKSAEVIHDATCTGFSGSGTADIRATPSGNVIATCQIKG